MKLEVYTPHGKALDVEVTEVTAPGVEGQFTVLPDHRPGLFLLGGGLLEYRAAGERGRLLVRGGLAEVTGERLMVLAREAQDPAEVDRERLESLSEALEAERQTIVYLDESTLRRLRAEKGYIDAASER